MSPLHDNEAFWRSSGPYVSASPQAADAADELFAFAAANAATGDLIFFQTSGSEGLPKWCGLSREGMLASARAVNAHLEANAKDRWLIPLPLHHVGGFSILARCFANGASWLHLEDKWDPANFTRLCASEDITLTSLVPTQVFDLVQAKLHAPSSLRAIVVGGAGLSKELGVQAQELGWPVLQSYGMTETASQIATEPLDHLYQGFDPERLEVLPIWDLSVDDEETLTVRGVGLAKGYAVKMDGTWQWQPMNAASGLRTRDRVQLWPHGTRRFLRFLGREASFVKIKGELVNVAALQGRLDKLTVDAGLTPGTALIWPLPHERQETRLILVGDSDGPLLEDLRARFNAAAARFEQLGEVRVLAGIPRTALGKVDRGALAALLESQ